MSLGKPSARSLNVQPPTGQLSKADVAGVFIVVQSGNLLLLSDQSTFCEFLGSCLDRLSDLLAVPFEEGVVFARGFEPVEVRTDLRGRIPFLGLFWKILGCLR